MATSEKYYVNAFQDSNVVAKSQVHIRSVLGLNAEGNDTTTAAVAGPSNSSSSSNSNKSCSIQPVCRCRMQQQQLYQQPAATATYRDVETQTDAAAAPDRRPALTITPRRSFERDEVELLIQHPIVTDMILDLQFESAKLRLALQDEKMQRLTNKFSFSQIRDRVQCCIRTLRQVRIAPS